MEHPTYLLYSQNGRSKKLEGSNLDLIREYLPDSILNKHPIPRGKFNYFYKFEGDCSYIEDFYISPDDEEKFLPNGNVIPLCGSYISMILRIKMSNQEISKN